MLAIMLERSRKVKWFSTGNPGIPCSTGNPGIIALILAGNPGIVTTMRVHLPNSAFLGNLDAFLRGLDLSEPDHLQVTANEKWLSLHPVAISMVAALGLTIDPQRIDFPIPEARSAHYLVRMHLFELLSIPCGIEIQEHAPEGRFIPLTQIRTATETSTFVTEMIPCLHLNPDQAETTSHIFSELIANVLEHSGSPNGAILCAQYYQKSNTIRIGIADTGVGLRSTINRAWQADSDLRAIQLALWPGITGTTRKEGGTAQNVGAGLFLIKSIANVNRDLFVIYSGNGFYKLLKKSIGAGISLHADPFDDRHSKGDGYPRWPGTVVGVDITLDQTRDFRVLLTALRKAFYQERKSVPKLKKPIFL